MPSTDDVDAFNARQVKPSFHPFIPREKGGVFGRCCVFSNEHPVHTTPPSAQSNVTLLGARRRKD